MTRPSQTYPTNKPKLVIILLAAILLAATIALLALNIIFNLSKKKISDYAQTYFNQKISIASIIYIPANRLVLRDVSIAAITGPEKNEIIRIPRVSARFSLRELFLKRTICLTNMEMDKPKTNYSDFYNFLKNNFKQIMELIRNLPVQDFTFRIAGANLKFSGKNNIPEIVTADFSFYLKEGSFFGSGSLCKNEPSNTVGQTGHANHGRPLKCDFKGTLSREGFSLDSLELTRENLYSKLWGDVYADKFRLYGFAFLSRFSQERLTQPQPPSTIKNLKALSKQKANPEEIIGLSKKSLYILDIDCQLTLSFPDIEIEHINFSLNNVPITLKGKIALSDPISLDMRVSSAVSDTEGGSQETIKKVSLKAKGVLKEGVFSGDSSLNLESKSKKKKTLPVETMEISFKDFTCSFKDYPHLDLNIGAVDVGCHTTSNEYKIWLEDFKAALSLTNERFKFLKFNAQLYDGFINGEAKIDVTNWPFRITSAIRARQVSANKLEGVLIHFSKVFGKLTSRMFFSNFPKLYLKGVMDIRNGYMHNFEFFKWLSDLFEIDSLRKVDFTEASSYFLVDDKGASLYRMFLNSKNVGLRGYFSLHENNFVNSKISLKLTRELLEKSPKFTSLLALLGKDPVYLDFDFMLSGNLHGMNFQWLQSDFKRKLQEAIPGFVQRRLEKTVEGIIDSIPSR